ncbi:MAG TPA: septum formation inhibitor Maf [Gammaproteobacteria bacterium]|nr:septum formation inhibitor Maf [Gammaproteobacteria bacterium]
MNPRIVLASRSPRRVELLRQIGIEPEVMPADIDEAVLTGETASDYVLRLAREKAAAIAAICPEAIVLSADTAVVLGEQIFGKPESADHAAEMLQALSGETHQVLSAVAVCCQGRCMSRVVDSRVTFRVLEAAEIDRYWATGEPEDKAGAYAIQGLGAVFVESIEGSYSAIMGLPLHETSELLADCGIKVLWGI